MKTLALALALIAALSGCATAKKEQAQNDAPSPCAEGSPAASNPNAWPGCRSIGPGSNAASVLPPLGAPPEELPPFGLGSAGLPLPGSPIGPVASPPAKPKVAAAKKKTKSLAKPAAKSQRALAAEAPKTKRASPAPKTESPVVEEPARSAASIVAAQPQPEPAPARAPALAVQPGTEPIATRKVMTSKGAERR